MSTPNPYPLLASHLPILDHFPLSSVPVPHTQSTPTYFLTPDHEVKNILLTQASCRPEALLPKSALQSLHDPELHNPPNTAWVCPGLPFEASKTWNSLALRPGCRQVPSLQPSPMSSTPVAANNSLSLLPPPWSLCCKQELLITHYHHPYIGYKDGLFLHMGYAHGLFLVQFLFGCHYQGGLF